MSRAGIIALLALACLAGGCLEAADFKGKKNPDFHVIGHRGAPNTAAENTIAAMEAAVTQGANALEIDLCLTRDGAVVLWHDLDPDGTVAVARQSGVEGLAFVPVVPPDDSPHHRRVDELDLADFLATHGYSRSVGGSIDATAPVALLADFLAWLESEPSVEAVYLDVKVDVPEQAAEIVGQIQAAASTRTALFYLSPRRAVVEAMGTALDASDSRNARVVWDFEHSGGLEGAEELGLRDVSTGLPPTRSETELFDELEEMLDAREKNRIDSVVVWTIDRRMQLGVLLYYGVDGIMTNDPATLHELWQRTLR